MIDRRFHLPEGVAAELSYQRADGVGARLQIAEPRDPFDVCNAVCRSLLPDTKFPDPDSKFDALMRARLSKKPAVQPKE